MKKEIETITRNYPNELKNCKSKKKCKIIYQDYEKEPDKIAAREYAEQIIQPLESAIKEYWNAKPLGLDLSEK